MNLNDYRFWTRETAIYPRDKAVEYLSLGLVSEAGEVAGKVKKLIRDGTIDKESLKAEVGDVFWYLARICDEMGWNPYEVILYNKTKLNSRKERGTLSGSGDNR